MAMMNLLVAFNGSASSEAALRYAAALARRQGAHVTALLAHSTHDTLDTRSRWIPDRARALLAEAKSGLLEEIEARLDALRPELALGDALSFRAAPGRVNTVIATTARCFDMVLTGRPDHTEDEHIRLHPDKIALLSGRPVIVVPEGYDADARHRHAALAWDGGVPPQGRCRTVCVSWKSRAKSRSCRSAQRPRAKISPRIWPATTLRRSLRTGLKGTRLRRLCWAIARGMTLRSW